MDARSTSLDACCSAAASLYSGDLLEERVVDEDRCIVVTRLCRTRREWLLGSARACRSRVLDVCDLRRDAW